MEFLLLKSYIITFLQVFFFHMHFCYFFNVKLKILPAILMFITIRLSLFFGQNWKTITILLGTTYAYYFFSKLKLIKCINFYVGYVGTITLYQLALLHFFSNINFKSLFYYNYPAFLFFAFTEFFILTIVYMAFPYLKKHILRKGFKNEKQ